MKKKNKIIAQVAILGIAFVGTYLFFNYLDRRKDNEAYLRERETITRENIVETRTDEPSYRVTTLGLANLGTPRYEYAITEYVYCPEDTVQEFTESMEIPWGDCSNMMYMDFRTLTDTTSAQYELQQYAWTDSQGFRRYGDYYMVAMGTYYGYVGDTFRITTDRGNCYDVILGDCKGIDALSYDGYRSWYHVAGDYRINVIEFIVDTYCLDGYAAMMGDCGVLNNIGGNVIKIERLN